ncbi:hypothetical protein Cs7R123_02080 [Catellatospora sp. TT07R-123]|uniref:hypothetical protein n=1 Tax=Catellatospora sp. TT07R-123 TaxID=2733863 RepID=UPI001B211028|nr:hypothetical protein [Catellatospora sp. TT07R-123]GHJ42866.1 hypothetical protein Cs7R123_02080 [Catellatospora sp. TT07R-123]
MTAALTLADVPYWLDRLSGRVAASDLPGAIDCAATMALVNNGAWGFAGSVPDIIARFTAADRERFAFGLAELAAATPAERTAASLGRLAHRLVEDLDSASEAEAVLRQLRLQAYGWTWQGWRPTLPEQVATVTGAGLTLPPEVVALIRRTATTPRSGEGGLIQLVAELGGPALNVGESWSEHALADLPRLGRPWPEVVIHVLGSSASGSAEEWEARGRHLLSEAGEGPARAVLTDWLAKVGEPRTQRLLPPRIRLDVNAAFDPYNAIAVRGLIRLLALLPQHPDTDRLLGAVADRSLHWIAGAGPRSPKTAVAAARALARIGSDTALAELSRLSKQVTHAGTRKRVRLALAGVRRS